MLRPRKPPGAAKSDRVYFEFLPNGAYIKVSAIDEKTGIEVSIVGDARATQSELQRLALRKLEKVMAKQEPKKRR